MPRVRFVGLIRFLPLIAFISFFIVPPLYGGGPDHCVAVSGVAQRFRKPVSGQLRVAAF